MAFVNGNRRRSGLWGKTTEVVLPNLARPWFGPDRFFNIFFINFGKFEIWPQCKNLKKLKNSLKKLDLDVFSMLQGFGN